MTTPLPSWPPRRTDRRTTAPYFAVPREADPARTGRRWVRRRARGMTAEAAAAALDVARFDARQNSRFEDSALDERGPAELGGWERIVQLLADATAGTVYDPDTDDVVRAELAADAAAAAAREAELREAMRIAARADELQALRELGTLDQAEPREGDEAVRDEITRREQATSRTTSTPGSPATWPPTGATTATRPPARRPWPVVSPRRSSRTPRCSASSSAWSPTPVSTSWRSRPGSPPPSPKPLETWPPSSPAPAPKGDDVTFRTPHTPNPPEPS